MSEQPDREEVLAMIREGRMQALRALLEETHPADIAHLLEDLPSREAVIIFSRLPNEVASEVLDETGGIARQELVEQVDDEKLADLLDEMPMDDAAQFLEDLPEPVSDRLLDLMDPGEADEVRELLSYGEDTAGRLMSRDVAALRRQWTVTEALDYLRTLDDEVETVHYLYVVDRDGRLIGVVPIRFILLAQPHTVLEDIMLDTVFSVRATADQEEMAEFIARYDYVAIPVVDDDGRLLGVVTVDDAMDALEEEVTEDFQRLGGSEPLEQPYFSASLWKVVGKRIGWLMLLFVAATLTGTVLQAFEGELQAVIVLGYFIPLVTGTGGNAGSQTVATIIRAITLGEVRLGTLLRAWRREIATGFLLGLLMGIMGVILALLWGLSLEIGLVVGFTLPLVVMCATTIATIVPTVADHYNVDPTVISGPMISTIVDTAGLAIYFSLAKFILGI